MKTMVANEDLKDFVIKLELLQRDIGISLEHCDILEDRLNYLESENANQNTRISGLEYRFENSVNIDTLEELIEYINNNKETLTKEQTLNESKNYIDTQITDCYRTIAKLNEQFSILNAKIGFIEKWIKKEQEQKDKWSFKDRSVGYL